MAAYSAYNIQYKYLFVNLVFPTSVLEWEFLSDHFLIIAYVYFQCGNYIQLKLTRENYSMFICYMRLHIISDYWGIDLFNDSVLG